MVLLRKTSLVDYPGKVGAVLFFPGCNLRCPWCQNRDLVLGITPEAGRETPGMTEGQSRSATQGIPLPLETALAHLAKRRSVLGGVVLSGGEPTLRGDLGAIIAAIKRLGLPVKLDTNGMNPQALEELFSEESTRPDYIALDLKFSPERYRELLPSPPAGAGITNNNRLVRKLKFPDSSNPAEALAQSAALIRASGIDHEYRSLILPQGHIGIEDIDALAPLADLAPWYFRPFIPGNCLDPAWNSFPQPEPSDGDALITETRRLGKSGMGGK